MKGKSDTSHPDLTRRALLHAVLAFPALSLIGCGDGDAGTMTSPTAPTTTTSAQPTPACADDDDPTPAQTEGPYFKPSSPERASLLGSDITGTRLIVAGQVLSTACTPISRALLDFWQADAAGNYDLVGLRLRGHQFTDDAGRFTLETIVPGLYPGRTRHIHVKVQATNGRILTTQLYFPNEPRNASDGIFSSALLMDVTDVGSEKQASFNFVLQT